MSNTNDNERILDDAAGKQDDELSTEEMDDVAGGVRVFGPDAVAGKGLVRGPEAVADKGLVRGPDAVADKGLVRGPDSSV